MDTCIVDWSHNFSNNYKQHVYSSKVCNVSTFIVIYKVHKSLYNSVHIKVTSVLGLYELLFIKSVGVML